MANTELLFKKLIEMEFVEYFKGNPKIILFLGGIIAILIAIMKGDIKIGEYGIPKLETKGAMILGGVGICCIIFGFFFTEHLKEPNNSPTALGHTEKIIMPKRDTILTKSIDIADFIKDQDKDSLQVSLVESTLPETSIKGKIITYKVTQKGDYYIKYKVKDGVDSVSANITIKVESPLPKLVTRKGQLINVFGIPKKGQYRTDLINQKETSPDSLITANKKGVFELRTQEDNELCNIFIQEDRAEFYLKYEHEIDTVEYKPLDTIEIVFCNSYDKNERKADSIIFKNRFKIPFRQLNISTEPNGNNDSLDYGELFLAIKYYGSFSADNKGTLDFYFIQKTGDKTTYDPVEITSNSSPSGWRSYVKKKLLKGEYYLIIKSKNGTELEKIEFEII